MVKKVIKRKKESGKLDVKKLSLEELYVLYQVTTHFFNAKPFSNHAAKGIISSRHLEVQSEVFDRVFGCDPYKAKGVVIQGADPTAINLDKIVKKKKEMFEDAKENKRFVVAKEKKEEE